MPSGRSVLTIDEATCEVWIGKQKAHLSEGEHDLLIYLWNHPRGVFERAALVQAVHKKKYKSEDDDALLNMIVIRLRQKIEADLEHPQIIVTKRGRGYMLDVHVPKA